VQVALPELSQAGEAGDREGRLPLRQVLAPAQACAQVAQQQRVAAAQSQCAFGHGIVDWLAGRPGRTSAKRQLPGPSRAFCQLQP
jgi:hypothetical protein